MKIYNAFGIKPTNTYLSAGSDYYIPDIKDPEKKKLALKAFEKSYNVSEDYINTLVEMFKNYSDIWPNEEVNLTHLFLALDNTHFRGLKKENIEDAMKHFINQYVIYDNGCIGLTMYVNDALFINSGIKIALDTILNEQYGPNSHEVVKDFRMLGIGVAGLYVNKSGMGNKGWDVRACLVDEDYAGFVHLSMAYTKTMSEKSKIYCGDKLTQMMLIPVFHTYYEEIEEYDYNKLMNGSQRGDSGFGSSDIKH